MITPAPGCGCVGDMSPTNTDLSLLIVTKFYSQNILKGDAKKGSTWAFERDISKRGEL